MCSGERRTEERKGDSVWMGRWKEFVDTKEDFCFTLELRKIPRVGLFPFPVECQTDAADGKDRSRTRAGCAKPN